MRKRAMPVFRNDFLLPPPRPGEKPFCPTAAAAALFRFLAFHTGAAASTQRKLLPGPKHTPPPFHGCINMHTSPYSTPPGSTPKFGMIVRYICPSSPSPYIHTHSHFQRQIYFFNIWDMEQSSQMLFDLFARPFSSASS